MSNCDSPDNGLKIDLFINDDDSCNITIKNVSLNFKNQLVKLIKDYKNLNIEEFEEIIFQAKVRSQIKSKRNVKNILKNKENTILIPKKLSFKPNFLNQIDASNNITYLTPIKTRKLMPIYDCKNNFKTEIENYINKDDDFKTINTNRLCLTDKKTEDDYNNFFKVNNTNQLCLTDKEPEDKFDDLDSYDNYSFNDFESESEKEIDYPEDDYSFDSFEKESYNSYKRFSSDDDSLEIQLSDNESYDFFQRNSPIIENDIKIEDISDNDEYAITNEKIEYAHPERLNENKNSNFLDIFKLENTNSKLETIKEEPYIHELKDVFFNPIKVSTESVEEIVEEVPENLVEEEIVEEIVEEVPENLVEEEIVEEADKVEHQKIVNEVSENVVDKIIEQVVENQQDDEKNIKDYVESIKNTVDEEEKNNCVIC